MAQVGQTLTCPQGVWSEAIDTYEYRPLRDGVPITGFSASNTYTLTAADVGSMISFEIRVTSAGGTNSGFSAAAVGPIEAAPDAGGGVAPSITGTPSIPAIVESGQPVTITPAAVTGTPTPTVTYQLLVSDDDGVTWSTSGSAFSGTTFTPVYADVYPGEVSIAVRQIATNDEGTATADSNGAEVILNPADLSPVRWIEPRIAQKWLERDGSQATLAGSGDPIGEIEDLGSQAANLTAPADNNRPALNANLEELDHDSDDLLNGDGLTALTGSTAYSHVHVGCALATTTSFLGGGQAPGVTYSPGLLRLGAGTSLRWYVETSAGSSFASVTVPGIDTSPQVMCGTLDASTGARRFYHDDWVTPLADDTIATGTIDCGTSGGNYGISARPVSLGFYAQNKFRMDMIFNSELGSLPRTQLRRYIEHHHGL